MIQSQILKLLVDTFILQQAKPNQVGHPDFLFGLAHQNATMALYTALSFYHFRVKGTLTFYSTQPFH